jgi:NAD(P)-dependent dehydrogenase (short-subunit alcohol dehydrogenase family)
MHVISRKNCSGDGRRHGAWFAIASHLAAEGATVVITGRRQQQLDDAVLSLDGNVSAIRADIANLGDLQTLYQTIQKQHGRIDVLVANAGVGDLAPLGEITEAHFDKIFDTNVKGVTFTVQGALPLMPPGASVVIIGSTASMDPGPGLSVYGASKAAIRNLVRSWIQEIKSTGVRINLVSPGPVDTPSLRGMFPDAVEETLAFLRGRSMVGRIGVPEDIARAVAFVASEQSGYINGIELFLDGGASQI